MGLPVLFVVSAIVYQREPARGDIIQISGQKVYSESDRRKQLGATECHRSRPVQWRAMRRWCHWRAGTWTRSGFTVTESSTRDPRDSGCTPISLESLLYGVFRKPFPVQERPACALSVQAFAGDCRLAGLVPSLGRQEAIITSQRRREMTGWTGWDGGAGRRHCCIVAPSGAGQR